MNNNKNFHLIIVDATKKAIFLSKSRRFNDLLFLKKSDALLKTISFLVSDCQAFFGMNRISFKKYSLIFEKMISNRLNYSKTIFSIELSNQKKNKIIDRKVVKYFISKGFVVFYKGYKNEKKGKLSVLEFTELFDKFLISHNISHKHILKKNNVLKDKEKTIVEFDKKKNYYLNNYNQLLSRQVLSYGDILVDFHPIQRIYNNSSYRNGGRFYGGTIQTLNKEKRKKILFNGKETVELDFNHLHISLIYSIGLKEKLVGDAYDLEKIKDRKLVKYAVMICLFSKSKKNAIKTILYKFFNNNHANKEYVEFLVNEILLKHQKIERFFFKPKMALRLQYLESRIAENIIKFFTKKNILVYPIHDSFIVEKSYQSVLYKIMDKNYKNIANAYSDTKILNKI